MQSTPGRFLIKESPFDGRKRRQHQIHERGEKMYHRYALYLKEMALAKTGNYMAFFPSYRFMEEVYECFLDMVEEENIQLDCLIQAPYMSEEARENLFRRI